MGEGRRGAYGCDAEIVEDLGEPGPWIGALVLVRNFAVEAVDAGDFTGFVISAQKCDFVGITTRKWESRPGPEFQT